MTPDSDMQLMKHPYCWIMWGLVELSLVHFSTQAELMIRALPRSPSKTVQRFNAGNALKRPKNGRSAPHWGNIELP
ncbi:hypothetical protein [Pseudomonas sp. sia0905]|uniref:hypothetical protein n=1 Tax=Pseudomonas sp. sia0905 TaxID=2854783 RepID=UPI001C466008|nr:hypothetical protein [Pseudomonas sp. sia0905]MBV7561055.1 hypothetical protein [Pseudomonas sp. sia0905]